jgi:O-antigen/teichoic acid export membrane protein
MQITKKDLLWNYAATFLKIASGVLLFPFILKMMPAETVGIWNIFITITALNGILDFGFNSSFTRNITYVFSGVQNLKVIGVTAVDKGRNEIDYGLLNGVIVSMRRFYSHVAAILFGVLITLGTYYIHTILKSYSGNHTEVYISWIILITINTYNLYTLYYDALLQGKGLVKRSKQIIIIGQTVYLIIACLLILAGFNLIAIVSAQALSVLIIRYLSYSSFFTIELKKALHNAIPREQKDIMKAIYPNAVKMGLTILGAFMIQKSAIIIGSLYLTLKEIASYGITLQVIGIIGVLAGIYTATYLPKISQMRVEQDKPAIKILYLKGQILLLSTFIAGGVVLLLFGKLALSLIGSQTQFMPTIVLFTALITSFLEQNHSTANGILLTNNEVPFFKASLVAGAATIILLIIMFRFLEMRLWAMVLAPGIAQLYNNFKWPYELFTQLSISNKDVANTLLSLGKRSTYNL